MCRASEEKDWLTVGFNVSPDAGHFGNEEKLAFEYSDYSDLFSVLTIQHGYAKVEQL